MHILVWNQAIYQSTEIKQICEIIGIMNPRKLKFWWIWKTFFKYFSCSKWIHCSVFIRSQFGLLFLKVAAREISAVIFTIFQSTWEFWFDISVIFVRNKTRETNTSDHYCMFTNKSYCALVSSPPIFSLISICMIWMRVLIFMFGTMNWKISFDSDFINTHSNDMMESVFLYLLAVQTLYSVFVLALNCLTIIHHGLVSCVECSRFCLRLGLRVCVCIIVDVIRFSMEYWRVKN